MSVTFARSDTVNVIPYGHGTWENGQPVADPGPSPSTLANQTKIVMRTFAQIEALEHDESNHAFRNYPSKANDGKVTFDQFLQPEQLPSADVQNRHRSHSSISMRAISSFKSLNKACKRKVDDFMAKKNS